ncbi:NAD(P)-dependent dehydrogenase, short-chain alcohol dehydrogenase family [Actinacidiphila yanglinensis]|uniref:NAD(P)-dependent dehydrogenase, short-chain alcohol dehydrogenase family n=1 Tax=Actinacidiphila yanglinensis TaxID=310779 RepID=A0A1H5VGF8_9ACTN|nr:SDR family oxidoreductase [Actinacidiphila yanglinensis]SEF85898.1 NAD(P)-dependent dehydrogenase, short-chain alcohol dehydrogenase family [Actinacidiphila yanglinensis]
MTTTVTRAGTRTAAGTATGAGTAPTADPETATSGGRLTGRTALVTGGSRGIGRGTALRLARDGARVGVHYGSNADAAHETVAAIEAAGGTAFALGADLADPDAPEALWAAFDRAADGLDILVNNAGIGSASPFAAIGRAEFDRLLAVNTRAPFFLTRAALPRMRDGGRIVNISTGLTRTAVLHDLIAYSMSKAALDLFTRDLSKTLGPRGITVNAVAPGIVDTDNTAPIIRATPAAWEQAAAYSALGRVGTPADIADVVAFLASDDARWITGHWLDASGGSIV